MGYSEQAMLSRDGDFTLRVSACAAVEIELGEQHPQEWANEYIWTIAASPGFADKYSSALVSGNPRPGNDPAVISDADILSAVQALEVTPP